MNLREGLAKHNITDTDSLLPWLQGVDIPFAAFCDCLEQMGLADDVLFVVEPEPDEDE